MNFIYILLASLYNENVYGASTYQNGTSAATGGPLANTGFDIIIPIALGLSVVIASVILLIKRLRARKQSA